jgi:hypothetical protein
MADKSTPLILEALGRAAAEPAGLPLLGTKGRPGLFAASAAAKQLAQRCKDEGLLRVVGTETRGKTVQEICALSDQGLAYLLDQVSPKKVLEDLARGLDARQGQIADLLASARQLQVGLDALKGIAEKILYQVQHPAATNGSPARNGSAPARNGPEAWVGGLMTHLQNWRASGALEDCPLPQLYRIAQQVAPMLSIGQFHDGLRRLHEQQQLYLHPWTGPLYELPEPALALLIGHVIAYYASLR